jgi:hypothetical protein
MAVFGSFAVLVGFLTMLIGLVSLIVPLRFLKIRTRRRGLHIAGIGLLAMFVGAPFIPENDRDRQQPVTVQPPTDSTERARAEQPVTVQPPTDSTKRARAVPGLASEIATWLEANPLYGTARSAEDMPNWARGRRQQVRTTTGAYLFYLEGGEVVTVYENDYSGRREVWRKPGH